MNFKKLTKTAVVSALVFTSIPAFAMDKTVNLHVVNNTDKDFIITQYLNTKGGRPAQIGTVKSHGENSFDRLAVDQTSTVFDFNVQTATPKGAKLDAWVQAELTNNGGKVSATLTDYISLNKTTPAIADNDLSLSITINGDRNNSFAGSTIILEESAIR